MIARQPVAPLPADLALEEPAAAQGEKDRFEELVGQAFLLRQVPGLDKVARPMPGELDHRPHPVLGSLRKPQVDPPREFLADR